VVARTRELVAEVAAERRRLLVAAEELDFSDRRERARIVAALDYGPPRQAAGEVK
jgi:hypothetical protein